jgi:predicted DNA-binding transcriptional regulator AlpA
MSKQNINRLIREGRFPRPVKLGYSTKVWVESEIDQYQASMIAKRDATLQAASPAAHPAE